MPTFEELDAITLEDLQATGATKWCRGGDLIGAFIAEMDFGIAPPITQRLHREVERAAFGYLPRALRTEMQETTADFLQQRTGWQVPPGDIHEMPDVIAVLQAVMESFADPEARLIVPTPAYMPFLSVPRLQGREVIEVEMLVEDDGTYRYDLAGIEAAFDAGGDVLVLCNPHNPTGRVFTRVELEEIVRLVDRKGGRVFSDEIWLPLTLSGDHVPYASLSDVAASHTVTAVAASKAFNLPGLKCAQLITSNRADAARWAQVGQMPMHGAANLGLAATSAAYSQGGPWLDAIRSYLRRNRDRLVELVGELLPQARLSTMEGTYIAWIDLRAYPVEGSLRTFLREHAGVECTDGTECGAAWDGFIRFVYATPQPLLIEAITRIGRALAGTAR